MRYVIAICMVMGLAGAARADAPRHAISMELPALGALGASVQYENLLAPRWSVAGGAGMRSAATDDYGSFTMSAGVEGRYWFTGRALGTSLEHTMIGPFVSARMDLAHTSIRMGNRSIGAALTITEMVSVGYRFALWRRLEITPHAGLGVRTELDRSGALPAWTHGTGSLGLTAGWLF